MAHHAPNIQEVDGEMVMQVLMTPCLWVDPNQLRWGPAFQILSLERIFKKHTTSLLTLGLFKFNFQRTCNSLLRSIFLTIIEVYEVTLLHMFFEVTLVHFASQSNSGLQNPNYHSKGRF